MARLTNKQLEKIKQEHNVDRIWSWSRINTFFNSKYEYLLKYILKEKEDRCDSCYTVLGNVCHNVLGDFYENKIKYEDMIENYNDGFLTAITIAGLKFNRSDEEKDKSIGEKYNNNLVHFFQNHAVYKNKLLIEKPIMININGEIFVGYIDALYKTEDGYYHILDFKSSGIYTGNKLAQNSGQLVLYTIGLHQMGIPLDKIIPEFNFLKYCTVKYEQKNGTVKYRNIERCKLGESLQSNASMWLKYFGYDPDEYLKEMIDTNSIVALPEEVKEKYEITDCHVRVGTKPDVLQYWTDLITTTIKDIRLREEDYKNSGNDKYFWDDEESVKAQEYYYANLCSYSISKLSPYKAYLDKLEAAKNGLDLFSGLLGSELVSVTNNNAKTSDNDLSWLDSVL